MRVIWYPFFLLVASYIEAILVLFATFFKIFYCCLSIFMITRRDSSHCNIFASVFIYVSYMDVSYMDVSYMDVSYMDVSYMDVSYMDVWLYRSAQRMDCVSYLHVYKIFDFIFSYLRMLINKNFFCNSRCMEGC